MPRRSDISKIMVFGSGPIVIGQACEFDYSGTQAISALKEEGYQVVLVNSNPATIMTDPGLADIVYIEPMTIGAITQIVEIECPDAILPTMGGQTALNLALALHENGVLKRMGIQLLGAKPEVIRRAEDRDLFKATMDAIGIESARSRVAHSVDEGIQIARELGLPCILRPSFTMGGEGGGKAANEAELREKLERALFLSPTQSVLIEESLLGWKEFEFEVVRDSKDNVIIVCSIENFDPMGIHTGDSITVAPQMTLGDEKYQDLRDQSIAIVRAIGVETGGCNIQFAVDPQSLRSVVIEMNPRVSRSSALASKATGFPIARVAAKLAVGYCLPELTNDITQTTPASFEPALDYVVVKVPRFDFEKFAPTTNELTTQMKSVGETMAIGRTFVEAFQKALVGLEQSMTWPKPLLSLITDEQLLMNCSIPTPNRVYELIELIRRNISIEQIYTASAVDPWFLRQLSRIVSCERELQGAAWPWGRALVLQAKRLGFSDLALAYWSKKSEDEIFDLRKSLDVNPAFLQVDTCAGEFAAITPFYYSTYSGDITEKAPNTAESIVVLGGGPNRIGQGIEFDYCCVHALQAVRSAGLRAVMINCNPETVSTDFDQSDCLYFEPVTLEHVMNVLQVENARGVILQFGGQTPLKLAQGLDRRGVRILGTGLQGIETGEDRKKSSALVQTLASAGLLQPPSAIAIHPAEALLKAEEVGFPCLVRPSFVLGGRNMRVIASLEHLRDWLAQAPEFDEQAPLLIDRFLNDAIEVDVDVIFDGKKALICGLLEHVEEAGVHSGDSACSLPAVSLTNDHQRRLRGYACRLAELVGTRGFLNVQFAIQGEDIYVLEINPRASRTVPFISKAVGVPIVKVAVTALLGQSFEEQGFTRDFDEDLAYVHVKEPVFPFHKFPNVDPILGPEMKSTGEVMGRAKTFAAAFSKAKAGAGVELPRGGRAFFSLRDADKMGGTALAVVLVQMDFQIFATRGTAEYFKRAGIVVVEVAKAQEGHPSCVDMINENRFQLVVNTVSEDQAILDSFSIRRAALERRVPCATILSSARAMVESIRAFRANSLCPEPLAKYSAFQRGSV